MKKTTSFSLNLKVLSLPIYLVLVMWLVYWLELRWGYSFSKYGILPGSISGIRGIVFGPFIHGSLKHLFNNSVPMLVLVSALLYFYPKQALRILIFGTLLTGFGTWLIGREAYHIGASGIVYMLVSYLLFQGLFSRNVQLISISLIVVFFYGSLIWYLFPGDPTTSWEGHSSGFVVGILMAMLNYKYIPTSGKKYAWEEEDYDVSKDVFMQHFDSKGVFHPTEYWESKKPETMSHTGFNDNAVEYFYLPEKTTEQKSSDELLHKE